MCKVKKKTKQNIAQRFDGYKFLVFKTNRAHSFLNFFY